MTLSQFNQPSIPPTSTHKNSRSCNWVKEVSLPPWKSAMTSCLYYLQDIKNMKLDGLKWHTKLCVMHTWHIIFPSLINHSANLSMCQEWPALNLLLTKSSSMCWRLVCDNVINYSYMSITCVVGSLSFNEQMGCNPIQCMSSTSEQEKL
jgi:hypothetical protein